MSASERLRRLAGDLRARRLMRQVDRAMRPPPSTAYARYGAGTVVVPPARIEHPEHIELGERVTVNEHAWFLLRVTGDLPAPRLRIGARTLVNRFAKIVCGGSVEIGEDVVIGDRCYISDIEHRPWTDPTTAEPPLTDPRPVRIGDRVLLSVGVVVKPGVTIGADAYVGAGAVVYDDVPPGAVAIGNPARLIDR